MGGSLSERRSWIYCCCICMVGIWDGWDGQVMGICDEMVCRIEIILKLNELQYIREMIKVEKAYKALSHIIYMKKYLIPQKPKKNPPFIIILQKQMHRILDSQKIQISAKQAIKLENRYLYEHNLIFQQLKNKYEEQKLKHKEQLAAYIKKYLDPPKLQSGRPFQKFVKGYSQYLNPEKKQFNLRQLSDLYNRLQATQKSMLIQAGQCNPQELCSLVEYKKIHEIPFYIPKLSHTMYMLDITTSDPNNKKNGEILMKQYSKLSQSQKNQYHHQAKIYNCQQLGKLEKFLGKWDVTVQEFQNIRNVCWEYEKHKKQKIAMKRTINHYNKFNTHAIDYDDEQL